MIKYKGIDYKSRVIVFEDQAYTIADEALNDAINKTIEEKKYDTEARYIDEAIVYYGSLEEMELSEEHLIKIIFKSLWKKD